MTKYEKENVENARICFKKGIFFSNSNKVNAVLKYFLR